MPDELMTLAGHHSLSSWLTKTSGLTLGGRFVFTPTTIDEVRMVAEKVIK